MHASIQTTEDAENLEIAKSMQVGIQNQKQKYHIRQNFHWLKFCQRFNHTLYWDKNFTKFNSPIAQVTFQEVVGGARELLCAHVRALMITRMCQNFHYAKKSWEKFSPTACSGKIGKNFLLAKISTYMVCLRVA